MNSRITAGTFFLIAWCSFASAQDFDADSIYYTPIPKTKPSEQVKKPKPFVEAPAQDTATYNRRFIEYFFSLQIGNLVGCTDCISDKEVSFTASTVHGVTIGEKLRIGGGIGFDSYYEWITMPAFGSASWDLLGTRNTNAIFVQFNYGWSLPWRTEKTFEYDQMRVEGGQMFYGMAGVRLKYHDVRVAFTIGGKFQSVTTHYETPTVYYDVNGIPVYGASSRTTIEESMTRFVMAVTIGWK